MVERRKSMRRRTLLDGRIEVGKLRDWAVTCAVRNVSEQGARLALPHHVMVPATFELGISGGAPKAARLVWYRDGQAGVAIDEGKVAAPHSDATSGRAPRGRQASAEGEPSLLRTRIDAIAMARGPQGRRQDGRRHAAS